MRRSEIKTAWKKFFKPSTKTLIVFGILFFMILVILSLITLTSPFQILKVAFEIIPIQHCVFPEGGAELCSYSPPRILFALPVFLILYFISCLINNYTKK